MCCHVRVVTWGSGLPGRDLEGGLAGLKPGGYRGLGMPKVGNCRRSALVDVI